jgi:arylsulfatase A-like enzyme
MGRLGNYSQGFRFFREAYQNIPNGDPITYASRSARRLNDKIFDWLDKQPDKPYLTGEQPLFLYVHSVDPHEEYHPQDGFLRKFGDVERRQWYTDQRRRLLDETKERESQADLYRTTKHFEVLDLPIESMMEYAKTLYDADILANDDGIDALFTRLIESGLLDDAIVIVTADHGDEFMEHGGTSHGFSLYNELIHVPLIFWGPGYVPEGVRVSSPVQSVDIYPTLLDLVDFEAPETVQGKSLVPLMHGEEDGADRWIFSEKRESPGGTAVLAEMGTAVAVLHRGWKFIRNYKTCKDRQLPERELYHLEEDPNEQVNLVDQYPAKASEYEAQIEAFLARNLSHLQSPEQADPDSIEPGNLELLRKLGYIE